MQEGLTPSDCLHISGICLKPEYGTVQWASSSHKMYDSDFGLCAYLLPVTIWYTPLCRWTMHRWHLWLTQELHHPWSITRFMLAFLVGWIRSCTCWNTRRCTRWGSNSSDGIIDQMLDLLHQVLCLVHI